MSFSRRAFMQLGTLAAASAAAVPVDALGRSITPARGRDNDSSDDLIRATRSARQLRAMSADHFRQLVGTHFEVQIPKSQTVWLTLISVNDSGSRQSPSAQATANQRQTTSFSLRFRASLAKRLPQGTYNFHNQAVGDLQLFIVPGGAGHDTYTATISSVE